MRPLRRMLHFKGDGIIVGHPGLLLGGLNQPFKIVTKAIDKGRHPGSPGQIV